MANIIPPSIAAGLNLDRLVTLVDYPAPAWGLSVVMRGASVIDLVATAEGSLHRLTASAATTAAWLPGSYAYSVRATRGADRFQVEGGSLTITPNLAAAEAGYDGRSQPRRTLDAINAVLEKRASQDQQKYVINNRELWRTPIPDLLMLRDRFAAEVRREDAAARGKSLWGPAVRVRF